MGGVAFVFILPSHPQIFIIYNELYQDGPLPIVFFYAKVPKLGKDKLAQGVNIYRELKLMPSSGQRCEVGGVRLEVL